MDKLDEQMKAQNAENALGKNVRGQDEDIHLMHHVDY